MKKNKSIIILIVILSIYALIIYFVLPRKNNNPVKTIENTIENQNKEKENYYLITNNANYEYYYNSFRRTSSNNIEKLDKLNIHINNKYFGEYKLKLGTTWNIFDNNNSYVNYEGDILAYSTNFNIKVRNIKIREINEEDKILLINNYNLNTFSYLTINQVIDIDLDNNGVEDEIICLSSQEESANINNYYNLILVKLNNEIIEIINEREEKAINVYSIYSVININDKEKDSIIISKTSGYYSESPETKEEIYNFKNNKYIID